MSPHRAGLSLSQLFHTNHSDAADRATQGEADTHLLVAADAC